MSKDLLFSFFKKVQEKGIIDEEIIKYLDEIFPNKSGNILEVIKRGITQHIYKPSNRIVWIAMGTESEHLVYPKSYCSCQDFYKSVVIEKTRIFCKHLLAQIICEALNSYNQKEVKDNEFKKFFKSLKLK